MTKKKAKCTALQKCKKPLIKGLNTYTVQLFSSPHALIIIYSHQSSQHLQVQDQWPIIPGFPLQPIEMHQPFSRRNDSALWICPEYGSFIWATCCSWWFHAVLLFARSLCRVSQGAANDIKIQSHPGPPPLPSRSPDSVWHSVGLVAVTLAVAGVLRPAGGTLVPPQSHRPMGEHRDAFGNAPAGLWREQCETKTLGHFQRSFLTLLRSRGNTVERDRERERDHQQEGQ